MAESDGWRKPNNCNDFIHRLDDKQQCLSAIFYLSLYIKHNKYEEKAFDDSLESDIQSNHSKIKRYLEKNTLNKHTADAIFIDICALIEAAPITHNKFHMMSVRLTRTTFNELSMKHRQNCMKYIVEEFSFDTGTESLYQDLLEYDNSSVIDNLFESKICKTTEEGEKWQSFLKQAIKEHAYHDPTDAVLFVKDLRIEWQKYHLSLATELDELETYLLQERYANLNTFEQFSNDLHQFNITKKQQQNKPQRKPNILSNEMFVQCTEICRIQNGQFRHLFMIHRDALSEFKSANRMQATQYIVTKYVDPQHAKQDKDSLITHLMSLTLGDMNSMYDVIFCSECDPSTDDTKQAEKVFDTEQKCIQFVNTLFPQNTMNNRDRHHSASSSSDVIVPYVERQKWSENECKKLLTLCNGIIGKKVDDEWLPNSIQMHSKLHPNTTFNLSVLDARDAVFWKIKNTESSFNTHSFGKKFQKYLLQQKQLHLISENDFTKLSELDGPSAFVTKRFLPYIPVLVALLNDDFKLNRCCQMTQKAMAQTSFRVSDIMNAFQLKDYDRIIHVDLVMLYESQMMDELEKTLGAKPFACDENEDFYAVLFETIAQKYIAPLSDEEHNNKLSVIRIFLYFEGEKPRTLLELCELKISTKDDAIEKKINHRKDPIYLPHVLYAFDRYQNLFINDEDDEKYSEELTHLQYSLIIFPQLLSDNETRTYINKQILCVREGVFPFNRSDINQLIPMMFKQNENQITREFIADLEREYGNIKNRKQFFYDEPLEKLAEKIDEK